MSRRQFFAIDEGLASAIAEEDDYFFGPLPVIGRLDDDSSDESEKEDEAPPSGSVHARQVDSESEAESEHYLDRAPDVRTAGDSSR